MHTRIIAAVTLAASLPISANAVVSSLYKRPLDACTSAIESEFQRAEVTDTFHRRLDNGRHEIYANVVSRSYDGEQSHKRVTCQTSTTGRSVLDLSAHDGRWIEREQG